MPTPEARRFPAQAQPPVPRGLCCSLLVSGLTSTARRSHDGAEGELPMRSKPIIFATCCLAMSTATAAQNRETTDTRKLTAQILQNCHITGGWLKVVEGPGGGLRAERSPSLTSDQNDCVSSYVGQPRTLGIDDAERRRRLQDRR